MCRGLQLNYSMHFYNKNKHILPFANVKRLATSILAHIYTLFIIAFDAPVTGIIAAIIQRVLWERPFGHRSAFPADRTLIETTGSSHLPLCRDKKIYVIIDVSHCVNSIDCQFIVNAEHHFKMIITINSQFSSLLLSAIGYRFDRAFLCTMRTCACD